MAQHFTDFSEYPSGQQPQGWTREWRTQFDYEVREDATAVGGKYLWSSTVSGSRNVLAWTGIGVLGNQVQVRGVSRGVQRTREKFYLLGGGAEGSETGLGVEFRNNSDSLMTFQYSDGTYTELPRTGTFLEDDYEFLIDLDGNELRVKLWVLGDPEPADWTHTVTHSLNVTTGWFGIGRQQNTGEGNVDWIGIGTEGDPAPTEPVGDIEPEPPTFDLEYRIVGETALAGSVPDLAETHYDLTGLTPGTSYEFRVRSLENGAYSPWTAWHQFTTLSPVEYLLVQDIGASVRASIVSVYDSRAAMASSVDLIQDGRESLSETYSQLTDGLSSLSSTILNTQDIRGAVASQYDGVHDIWGAVITPYRSLHDIREAVATPYDILHDIRAAVASQYDGLHDARAAIASQYTGRQDGQVKVSELVNYFVLLDAIARVRNSFKSRHDVRGAVMTPYNVLNDIRAVVKEQLEYYVNMDVIAKVSNSFSGAYDIKLGIGRAFTSKYDIWGGISTPYAGVYDARAAVREMIGYYVLMDIVARISTPFAGVYDGRSSIITPYLALHDVRSGVHMPYSALHDLWSGVRRFRSSTHDAKKKVASRWRLRQDGRVVVRTLGQYVAKMDAVAAVSKPHRFTGDAMAAVSDAIVVVQDARAAISEAKVLTQADGALGVSNVISVRQDAVAGVATSYEMLMDIAAGVSNPYAVIHDGVAYVLQVDFIQRASVEFVSSGRMSIHATSKALIKQAFKSKAITFVEFT